MIKGTNETQIVVGLDLASPYGMVCVFWLRHHSEGKLILECCFVMQIGARAFQWATRFY